MSAVAERQVSREQLRERARELRAQGLFPSAIGRELGVSRSTIIRWLDPAEEARNRERSRAAKRRRTGTCESCGGVTRYNGKRGLNAASRLCGDCARAAQRVWTRDAVIDAIQRFAAVHGRPPYSTDWITADPVNGYPPRSAVYRSSCKSGKRQPFESWAAAIEAAGFPRPLVGKREGQRHWTDDSVLEEIRRITVDGRAKSTIDPALTAEACWRFGSWQAACRAAGVMPMRFRRSNSVTTSSLDRKPEAVTSEAASPSRRAET